MTNKRTGNGKDRSRLYDCASRDETARGFAQDDRFLGEWEKVAKALAGLG
jgi:hypothetical protein